MTDEYRRRTGTFPTPKIWVDEAHKMISEAFGENWKDEYVVWDPASGTLNLTRDYKFKELYCSTLEESDLKTAEQMRYNPEAVKFQYDFLNDGIVDGKIDIEGDMKLPEGLKRALIEGKKMIVLMNPPYATTANFGSDNKEQSGNDTSINSIMKLNNMGRCSDSLYGQFIFRLFSLNKSYNLHICFFSPPLIYSGESFINLRKLLVQKYIFRDGFLIDAAHFMDVQSWGLSFTILNSTKSISKMDTIKLDVLEFSDFCVRKSGTKLIYNTDSIQPASKWVRLPIKGLKTSDAPQMKSAINWNQNGKGCRGNLIMESFGFFYSNSNNVDKNENNVGIFTSCFSSGAGCSITINNFNQVSTFFLSRKIIKKNWQNSKDEYMAPNESHPLWEQFQNDSVVYSLFNTSSNQSSLRQITYKDKLWDIKNEFFWMSKSEMMDLAEKKFFDDVYRDARKSDERYVYNLLHKEGLYDKLSPDAKEVLDMASELVRKTFGFRKVLHEEHPEYHLNTWDAGWYQIKLVLKQFFPDQLKEFTKKYKEFEDRMRPLVYELGFLRK